MQAQRLIRYLITIQKLKFQIRGPLNKLCLSQDSVLDRLVIAIIKKTNRRDIIALTVDEVKNLLRNKKVNNQNHRQISSCLQTQLKSNKVIIKTGAQVKKLAKQLVPKLTIKELVGTIACKGLVRGKVRIIPLSDNPSYYLRQFKKGEILVSETTGPELMPAIRKASAIVTDEGGLMSHAALISREFKIPCIVGTKLATKMLKNGNFIEVNANNGIVKILKSK
ncbi:MAG: PEP-utilizing enzyme [Candidatus Komeilibacteria bacterium]|nr:PEP-utilizing enzyme [Candidatus Komeilibacteria bacterium]